MGLLAMAAGSTDKSVWGEPGEARLVSLHHRVEVSRLSLPTVLLSPSIHVLVLMLHLMIRRYCSPLCFSKRELFIATLLFFLHHHV